MKTTVQKLIQTLSQFNPDAVVYVDDGEGISYDIEVSQDADGEVAIDIAGGGEDE